MTSYTRSRARLTVAKSAVAAIALLAVLIPSSALGGEATSQRYLVVFKGDYALDGSYALGAGYALVAQTKTETMDGTYALGNDYALYALNQTYALLDQYALTPQYAQDQSYALFGQYALASGYALGTDYALGSGYALASQTGTYALDSSYALTNDTAAYALGSNYALLDAYALDQNYALARDYALWLVMQADPSAFITADLTRQAGVLIVDSKEAAFARTLESYALVQEVGKDFGWKQFPSYQQALNSGQLVVLPANTINKHSAAGAPDPLTSMQWDMNMISAPQAHLRQLGKPGVKVGIIDTGIDGNDLDFQLNGKSNVDCADGADFTTDGPGIGSPLACVDNQFHGTHVAGTIGARQNGIGVTGVAPNVTLVPIKVCDANGDCYVSDAVQGISYAGDLRLNVINMSFYVDDNSFDESTEFKCQSDSTQRAYREAITRALHYARQRGVTEISALGNEDTNLAKPPGGKKCKVVPAQVSGVAGTAALGPTGGKASYSNWGNGWADIAAPGGDGVTGDCTTNIVSTLPGNLFGCISGTSMASPHAAGVAALIISQFGKRNRYGQLAMSPDAVYTKLTRTAVDIGAEGSDKCFGFGRIDALRAVKGDTSHRFDESVPACAEPN